jgi:hypothetical protein
MSHNRIQKLLYEFVRGELDPQLARVVESHLATCDACFSEYQIIREALRMLPTPPMKPSEARSETFWREFVESVDNAVQRQRPPKVAANPVWDQLWSLFTFRRPALVVVGAMTVACVAIALWISSPDGPESTHRTAQTVWGVQPDSVRLELARYLRKSKVLLVGISNISAVHGERVDLSVEREAARTLIRQARYFDDTLSDERARQLVIALERILLELANIEQQADVPDVEIVRSGINQENMLFKIRMAESEFGPPENSRSN